MRYSQGLNVYKYRNSVGFQLVDLMRLHMTTVDVAPCPVTIRSSTYTAIYIGTLTSNRRHRYIIAVGTCCPAQREQPTERGQKMTFEALSDRPRDSRNLSEK